MNMWILIKTYLSVSNGSTFSVQIPANIGTVNGSPETRPIRKPVPRVIWKKIITYWNSVEKIKNKGETWTGNMLTLTRYKSFPSTLFQYVEKNTFSRSGGAASKRLLFMLNKRVCSLSWIFMSQAS